MIREYIFKGMPHTTVSDMHKSYPYDVRIILDDSQVTKDFKTLQNMGLIQEITNATKRVGSEILKTTRKVVESVNPVTSVVNQVNESTKASLDDMEYRLGNLVEKSIKEALGNLVFPTAPLPNTTASNQLTVGAVPKTKLESSSNTLFIRPEETASSLVNVASTESNDQSFDDAVSKLKRKKPK